MYVVAKEIYPCKIISTSTSKTGKHGHAKIHILCADIFTDKKFELHESTQHSLSQPLVEKIERNLVNLKADGEVNYLRDDGTLDERLKMDISSDLYK